jgi:hypothetical protein
MTTTIKFENGGPRRCGGCTLCCKLLPMVEDGVRVTQDLRLRGPGDFNKPAGQRCPHQRFGKGCAIYNRRPACCALWNCRWLVNNDTADLRRPDRSHYVIDIMPDFITLDDGEHRANVEVVQIWVDPNYRDAYRDPALLAYLTRRGEEGIAAIIRYSESDGFVLFPPAMTHDGQWKEQRGTVKPERTSMERFAGIAQAQRVKV